MKLADTTYKFEHGVDSTIDGQTKELMDTTSMKSDSSGSLINLPLERRTKPSSTHVKCQHTRLYFTSVVSTIVCLVVMIGIAIKLHSLSNELDNFRRAIEYQRVPQAAQMRISENQTDLLTKSTGSRFKPVDPYDYQLPGHVENNTVLEREISAGSVYIHWGKKNCSGDAQTLYSGHAAGSSVSSTRMSGGGVQYLCMPQDPEWNRFDRSNDTLAFSWVYAAEILSYRSDIFRAEHHGTNVACSVCWVPRAAKMMIPAKRSCPSSEWSLEYEGYLMASMSSQHKSMFECVDENPDYIPGRESADGGALFYFVAAYCKGNSGVVGCPPYIGARELTCSICTR